MLLMQESVFRLVDWHSLTLDTPTHFPQFNLVTLLHSTLKFINEVFDRHVVRSTVRFKLFLSMKRSEFFTW